MTVSKKGIMVYSIGKHFSEAAWSLPIHLTMESTRLQGSKMANVEKYLWIENK